MELHTWNRETKVEMKILWTKYHSRVIDPNAFLVNVNHPD